MGGMLRELWDITAPIAMDASCECVYDHSPLDKEHTDTDTLVDTLNDKQDKLMDRILMRQFNPPSNPPTYKVLEMDKELLFHNY